MMSKSFVLSALLVLMAGSGAHDFGNAPDWTFSPPQPPDDLCLFTSVAAWDFDADNDVELAVCSYRYDHEDPVGGSVYLLDVTLGQLQAEWTSVLHAGYQCLLWADVDGDSDEDLVAGTSVLHPGETHASVVYFENVGGLLSSQCTDLSATADWDVMDLTWGDFNFDALPDILVTRTCGEPVLLSGQSSATPQGWTLIPSVEQELAAQSFHGDGSRYRSSIWDANEDGFLDIALGNRSNAFQLLSDDVLLCYGDEE